MTKDKIKIYTVSDSTGETVQGIAKAVGVNFENIEEFDWTLIKTSAQLEKINEVLDEKSIVLYTLVDNSLAFELEKICNIKKCKVMSVLKPVSRMVKSLGGIEKKIIVGAQHAMDDDYFARVDAIDFASVHDDGQGFYNINESDIVIIGASRTSKSPTSFYLANKGYKTSNIPFVDGIKFPDILFNLPKQILVVGLVRDAESLVNIRRSRLKSLSFKGVGSENDYTNFEKIEKEMLDLKKICNTNYWPIISVQNKSIEETATQIIKYFHRHQQKFLIN